MKHVIDKRFDFCYGHRVYVQKLRSQYCSIDDCQCKCRHNHGHQGALYVHVSPLNDELNEQSMVVDFKELGWLKDVIDNYIDHKFIVDFNDPMFNLQIAPLLCSDPNDCDFSSYTKRVDVLCVGDFQAWIIDPGLIDPTTPTGELLEGYLVVNFVPTSEMLAEWLGMCVKQYMKDICNVEKVVWSETPKTSATYSI